MKLQKLITLWCISAMCLLTSCEKEDTPTKINPADYAKYASETTATYNLIGKVKTVEKIYYYSQWDNVSKTVQRKDATSKTIYEFDENGVSTGYTFYYIDSKDSQFKKGYSTTIEYDNIYRVKTRLSETYSPNYRIGIPDGYTIKYVSAIKYTTEYNEKQKTATEIVTCREENQEVFTPHSKTVYLIDNENRIDGSTEIQIYEKKVRAAETSSQSSEESVYSTKANNIIKKDSKGNIVESYSIYTYHSSYTDSDYNNTTTSADSFYEQKITYYDGPASNNLTGEITGNANARLMEDIPNMGKTKDLGLKGKVKTLTEYIPYIDSSSPSWWDPITNTIIKRDFQYKIISQYNLLGILTEKKAYQKDSNRNASDNLVPYTLDKYQIDSKSRITEAYSERYFYNSNGTLNGVDKIKKVLAYDDINKKATLTYFSSTNDSELKKGYTTYVYNLKEDGSIDNSYRERHMLRSTASDDDPFEEKPSTTIQYITEYDSQNNWIIKYSLNKELGENGKMNTRVATYSERTIVYY